MPDPILFPERKQRPRHTHCPNLYFVSVVADRPVRVLKEVMAKETTLILLKTDAVRKGICGEVIRRFEAAGLQIRGAKMMSLSRELLAEHYAHIADKPFFPEIVDFMRQTPVIALALTGDNAIERVRDLLGPTNSKEAPVGSIRGDMGQDMMVNVAHASDSPENAVLELKRFFNEGEIFDYDPALAIPDGNR